MEGCDLTSAWSQLSNHSRCHLNVSNVLFSENLCRSLLCEHCCSWHSHELIHPCCFLYIVEGCCNQSTRRDDWFCLPQRLSTSTTNYCSTIMTTNQAWNFKGYVLCATFAMLYMSTTPWYGVLWVLSYCYTSRRHMWPRIRPRTSLYMPRLQQIAATLCFWLRSPT